jgi:NodT family efflux transporter outer membrane factor (OMF) lipoprotein
MSALSHRFLVVLVLTALGGCALQAPPKPDEIKAQSLPNLNVPPTWVAAGGSSGAVRDGWLADFNDPQLTALVNEALAYNVDLQAAAARVELAAGQAKLAGATIYPAVNLLARGGGKMGGDSSGINGVGLFANWELDLWGRARYEREAGSQQYESVVLDAEYARQSIAALVVKSWLLAIEARIQLGIASEIVRSSGQVTGLARDRLRIGPGDEYDVALAEANFETARDAARQLALGYAQALRALELLLGRYPSAAIEVPIALPAMPSPVPAGLPSELLERRPDVIAAERRVAAAFNRVGEAKAARLPKISLTGSVTSISSDLFVLQNHANPVASLGAMLLAPLFQGYALQANVDIRTAEQKLAVAEYGRIGARAFNDVETALSAGFTANEREAILLRAVESNVRSVDLAQVRYRVGSGDLRAVLTQSVALYGARTGLVHVQSDQRIQRVNLYLALGGSFEQKPTTGDAASHDDKSADASGATPMFNLPGGE